MVKRKKKKEEGKREKKKSRRRRITQGIQERVATLTEAATMVFGRFS